MLSFIVAFGVTKAICNYFTGRLANRLGRKRLLIIGWLFALPVPFILIYAPDWNWVVAANVLLGINQGLSWSAAVMMKIDLVGEKSPKWQTPHHQQNVGKKNDVGTTHCR